MSANKKIHIITGGTLFHITPHHALSARAYGRTGYRLATLCSEMMHGLDVVVHPTRMAGGDHLETNEHIAALIDELTAQADTKIVFMPVSLVDFNVASALEHPTGKSQRIGKHAPRFSSKSTYQLMLEPAPKVISRVRTKRKDIFLVGFKTTSGLSADEQYIAALRLLKGSSCNLVLANDTGGLHMVVTPEEARYHVTTDREEALRGLVEMTKLRSHLTFTRSTVIAGEPVPWASDLVPASLRAIVDHCIARKAYKPFSLDGTTGATVGHFAAKIGERVFLTSQRKTNFNDLAKLGLVRIETDGPDSVLAYGAKPSVGGQSQRIAFEDHPQYDCIVHFHCPIRPGSKVPTVSQREYECGSHECGRNMSRGLDTFGHTDDQQRIYEWDAVYLDQHGPNIVFHHSIDPQIIINFIEENFDLSAKTGGYVTLPSVQR